MPLDEPCMSDRTLLVSVEDLISIAFGPSEQNVVNFKVIQTILHILARQQRLLQQKVEIRITEVRQEPSTSTHKKLKRVKETGESSSSSSPRTPRTKKRASTIKTERHDKVDKEKAKAEKEAKRREEKEKSKLEKEKARLEKEKGKEAKERERELKSQEKADRSARKEMEKAERSASQEREKAERSASKEREKAERAVSKEREKAERAAEKEREKAERSASKERDKADKVTEKEREKAERSASKEREKAERAAEKEKEKAERSASKEREKAEKSAEKEKEKEERAASKEREKAEKEREKAERSASKEREKADRAAEKEAAKAEKEKDRRDKSPPPMPGTKDMKKKQLERVPSVNILEVDRGKEKVLVVEKGPTTRSEPRSRGSIDVVTQSQFALLEAAVRGLQQRAAPLGQLRMPDNERLKSDLARGSASLTDTMNAMQVDARVKAAEEAIDRMAGLLTKLAAAGAVPDALADEVLEAKLEAERTLASDTDDGWMPIQPRPSTARKSVMIDPMVKKSILARPSTAGASELTPRASVSTAMGRASILSRVSSTFSTASEPKVSKSDMEDIIKAVRDDLWKGMNSMTMKATLAAESAMHTAKAIAEKLDVALQLDRRISTLQGLVEDYADQLSGFDAGLTTQMQSFQEQIMQIRHDLTGGLTLLENVNNNAETAAVMALTERYEELATELDRTMSAHRLLSTFQGQLGNELRSLVECVEMLREQKADREEVIDGLRDKADSSRLAGLLTEAEFAVARAELNRRLEMCHDKFRRQDGVWMVAIKDLMKITDLKADIIDLMSVREDTQRQLRELHDRARLLAAVLGEPKAALLTRQLARDAQCGACAAASLMEMRDPCAGAPPALPALRPPPAEPCLAALRDRLPVEKDDRHICLRWVGGSHTLVSDRVTREEAPPSLLQGVPTRKFTDYGMDGRLYMMEEELQPCMECNALLEKEGEELERPAPVGEEGAGDRGQRTTTALNVQL